MTGQAIRQVQCAVHNQAFATDYSGDLLLYMLYAHDIITLLQEIGKSEQAFCKYKKIESLDKLPADQFEAIVKELEGWRK